MNAKSSTFLFSEALYMQEKDYGSRGNVQLSCEYSMLKWYHRHTDICFDVFSVDEISDL